MIRHPPKPRLALTLGVTGHRLRRAPAEGEAGPGALRVFDIAAVGKALDQICAKVAAGLAAVDAGVKQNFSDEAPIVTLVSALAEGADRLAAQAALSAGFALDVALPCAPALYKRSFADAQSNGEFDTLLARARARLVLPLAGDAAQSLAERLPIAFEAAGLTMLALSDILIAVWDGKPADGRGGTGQIVEEAARRGAPIIIVDPENGAARLLWAEASADESAVRRTLDIPPCPLEPTLATLIARLVAPPSSTSERAELTEFLNCRLGATASRRASRVFDGRDFDQPRAHWPRVSAAVTESNANRDATRVYAEALLASEEVAVRNAGRYRLLFLFSSSVTVVASALVAGAARFRELHFAAAGFEFVTVALVGGLVFYATRRRWHSQWFEARELAERLRVVAPTWLLGARPAHLKPTQAAWPGWYARAITRELPLFSGELADLLGEIRDILAALVDEQLAYHLHNAERLERRDRVYEGIGLGLLLASLANNVAYLVAHVVDPNGLESFESWGLAAAIFLPAAATASYGVRLFGDYEDLARRSRRTAEQLRALKARMSESLDLRSLRGAAEAATRAMLSDLDAWRVAVESRRLSAS
ncbi:MAG: hypothetical protein E7774_02305 [Bradyrhizobium sp.]|nr:MAG: hypothetical protein E7774_02305 [Bradyrhizobium sp.]